MPWRKKDTPEKSPLKLLLWTALAGLVFGLIGFGELAEDWLRVGRNSLHWNKASGDILIVTIDDDSQRKVGRWPWPRRYHAELIDRLDAAGAKRIFFDIIFDSASSREDDARLAEAIARSGKVTLPVRARSGPDGGAKQNAVPLPMFGRNAELGSISVYYNYQSAVWKVPYAADLGDRRIPTYAAKLARVDGPPGRFFMPDYSIDPMSVPAIPAAAVLGGSFDPARIAGKDVVVGVTSDAIGDQYFIPGTGRMGGAYVQIIGAETLKNGRPVHLGWFGPLLVALAIAGIAVFRRGWAAQNTVLGTGAVLFLLGPTPLEARLVMVDVTPALFVIITIACALGWRRFRLGSMVDSVSGLPNLTALRANSSARSQALIVARILNYSEIVAALPSESEKHLVEQIVSRLSVGHQDRTLYHGDGGIFAWFEEPRLPFGHHIEALHSLFRNPVKVGGLSIDLSVSFGVEIGSSRSLANRLGSALLAAEEAAHDGLKWKYYDPESLQDASWKLSMLSQLDAAIDKGEVWVAYQPKLDLKTRRIIGAEALARWTHPEKGPIAASEFVAAAEQHDRIGKLTEFVLDKAIGAAAAINKRGLEFDVAVNLSARLLNDSTFTGKLSALLASHGLEPRHLTLELTETAALAGSGAAIDMLCCLRELGINISIDDYGTGLSTLDYLKKIPAGEIKIDQSFVKGMCDNRSDRLMVQSTIGLAHSLGRKVVAEGVEHRDILEALIEMKCDVGQGFVIGRPMSLDSLTRRLATDHRRAVA